MKRQLLFFFAAISCMVSANAFSVGDYIYTPTAKLKVMGANLVSNGDFSGTTTGWTTTTNASVDMAKWSIKTGVGPSGVNVIESQNISGTDLARSISLEAGKKYSVSYSIYATSAFSTSVTAAATNYVGIYADTDGSFSTSATGYRLVNEVTGVKAGEWQTVNDTVTANSAQMLQIVFQNIAEGTQITNVEVHEISTVYDDRIANRVIDYCNYLAGLDEWAKANPSGKVNGLDEFNTAINGVKEAMKTTEFVESESEMSGAITSLVEAESKFLDANSADMKSQFTSWVNGTKYQNTTAIGDWVLSPARWYHCNNSYTDADKAEIYFTYPGAYDLTSGSDAVATLTKSMSAGRYMFAVDLKGFYFSGTTSSTGNYTPNYESAFYGAKVFANNDYTTCDTLPTRYYQTYTKFFTAPEGTNNVSVGATFTLPSDMVGKKLGGSFNMANAALRMLGTNQSEQNRINGIKAIQAAQTALKVMMDSAVTVKAKAEFPWGKAVLQDSIDLSNTRYNASLGVIDASGNVINDDQLKDADGAYTATPEYATTLNTFMKYIRTSIQNYYTTNAPYTTLVADLAGAKSVYNDNTLDGSATKKSNLKTLIDQADALIAGVTGTEDATFTSLDASLLSAKALYLASAANYDTPAAIDIVNPFFLSNVSGWTLTEAVSGKEGYKRSSDANFDNGFRAGVWRGNTVSPTSKFKQEITLSESGIYEYRSNGYAFNEYYKGGGLPYDIYMATVNGTDTTYNRSEVKFFFGETGAPDSVRVHSRNVMWAGATSINGYIPSKYSVFCYVAPDKTPVVELGMSSYGQISKQGANAYGFGDNYVFYYGKSLSGYLTGAKKDLNTAISTADALLADTLSNTGLVAAGRVFIPRRLAKAVAEAKLAYAATASETDVPSVLALAKRIANAKWAMMAAEKDMNRVVTGVKGVFADDKETLSPTVKGVFSLSGVKVASDAKELNTLPKGIYIVNGKKYVVK